MQKNSYELMYNRMNWRDNKEKYMTRKAFRNLIDQQATDSKSYLHYSIEKAKRFVRLVESDRSEVHRFLPKYSPTQAHHIMNEITMTNDHLNGLFTKVSGLIEQAHRHAATGVTVAEGVFNGHIDFSVSHRSDVATICKQLRSIDNITDAHRIELNK